jgi:hypothetical protein
LRCEGEYGERVTQAPEESDPGCATDGALANHDSRHGNDMVSVGRMKHSKQKAQHDDW